MKNKIANTVTRQQIFHIICICLLLYTINPAWSNLPNDQSNSPSSLKLYGKVDIVVSACATAGITLSTYTLPSIITRVRLGSSAFYSNLAAGDKLISGQLNGDQLHLVIDRNGTQYSVDLHTGPSSKLLEDEEARLHQIENEYRKQKLAAYPPINGASQKESKSSTTKISTTKIEKPADSPTTQPDNAALKVAVAESQKNAIPSDWQPDDNALKGGAQEAATSDDDKLHEKQNITTIKDVFINHDLILIVDHSESMDSQDCPGKLTRWQWCCQQTVDLAQAIGKAANSITVVFFNDNYRVFNNAIPSDIPTFFSEYNPTGGTVLARPLQKELDDYFRSRVKPLTIVIITDGEPEDRTSMARLVKETSDRLHYAGEITITFLLISNEVNKDQLQGKLGLLPNSSVAAGGLVDIIPFSTVSTKGIKQTLFEELRDVRLNTNKFMVSKASQFATGISIDNRKHKRFLLW